MDIKFCKELCQTSQNEFSCTQKKNNKIIKPNYWSQMFLTDAMRHSHSGGNPNRDHI